MIPEFFGIKGVRLARVSAISGRELEPGDLRIYVSGTPYFYGVRASEKHLLTPEKRAEIEAQVPRPQKAAKAVEVKEG